MKLPSRDNYRKAPYLRTVQLVEGESWTLVTRSWSHGRCENGTL